MKKILILTLWLSLQPLFSHTAGLQRARLAKALFVTAGAAAGIGAYYANKIGDARYKAMYAQLYPSTATQTYPNQNNRFLRTARNILTVLSGADTVDATALNGDKPPRLYRFFSSIPGWESLAQKTGIRNIAPEVVTLDAQNLDSSKYTLAQNGLTVIDTSSSPRLLNINPSKNVTSDLYGRKHPVRFKVTNMPAQITPVNAQQQIPGAANLGQQSMQPPSPTTAFSAPTNEGFGPQYGQQGHGAPSAAVHSGSGFYARLSAGVLQTPLHSQQLANPPINQNAMQKLNQFYEFLCYQKDLTDSIIIEGRTIPFWDNHPTSPACLDITDQIPNNATFQLNVSGQPTITFSAFNAPFSRVPSSWIFITQNMYNNQYLSIDLSKCPNFITYQQRKVTLQQQRQPVPPAPASLSPFGQQNFFSGAPNNQQHS